MSLSDREKGRERVKRGKRDRTRFVFMETGKVGVILVEMYKQM